MHFQKKKETNLLIDFTTFLYIINIHECPKIINGSGILDPLNKNKVNSQIFLVLSQFYSSGDLYLKDLSIIKNYIFFSTFEVFFINCTLKNLILKKSFSSN